MGCFLRHTRLPLALLAAAVVSVATSCHKSSSSPLSVVVTPVAPTDVAATAGFHTVSLTWNLVSNATGYRIYTSPTAITSTSGLPGTFVNSSPYVLTNQTDWVTEHIRISAVIAAVEGPLSAEVLATPNGGWVMATSSSAGNALSWYEADADGVLAPFPTPNSIPGGQVVATVGTGVMYSISSGGTLVELGYASSSGTTPYIARTAGHSLVNIGAAGTPARQLVADFVGGKATISSFPLTGGAAAEIQGGCFAVTDSVLAPVGAILECDQVSGTPAYFQTDGSSAGVELAGTLDTYIPVGVSSVAAYYFDTASKGTVVQAFDGTITKLGLANGTAFFAGDTSEEVVAVGSGTATSFGLLIHVEDGATGDDFELCELNGASCIPVPDSTPSINGFEVLGLTSDGKSALILATDSNNAFLEEMSLAGDSVNECPSCATMPATELSFLPPSPLGPLKVAAFNTTGWHLVDQDTGANDVDLVGSTDASLVGAEGGFVLLYNAGPSLKAYPYAGTAGLSSGYTLSFNNATDTRPLLYANLSIIWLADDGTTFIGTPDGVTILPTRIDTAAATSLSDPSFSSDGRYFWNATRPGAPSFQQVMSWIPGTTNAVVVAGTNGLSVTGTFVPQ